jgi:hypothetical protein
MIGRICATTLPFTGYTVNGGYAEFALVRADFTIPLPDGMDDQFAAPLLCAGVIGTELRLRQPAAGLTRDQKRGQHDSPGRARVPATRSRSQHKAAHHKVFSLDDANTALVAVKQETEEGSAVIVP